jgi:transcriptional regulator with XRE-family HTH domain
MIVDKSGLETLMPTTPGPTQPSGENQRVAARIRTECIRRGWDLQEFSRRAGLSRTTLYNLEHGHTGRPHATTVGKLAAALNVSPEELLVEQRDAGASAIPARESRDDDRRRFDAATNPAVADVMRERPDLFSGWTDDDTAELYSLFGVGGELNQRGVVCAAEAINRKRETVRKLHIVLETHLAARAIDQIEFLYDLVCVTPRAAPPAQSHAPDPPGSPAAPPPRPLSRP